jgi:hypothetical protein
MPTSTEVSYLLAGVTPHSSRSGFGSSKAGMSLDLVDQKLRRLMVTK